MSDVENDDIEASVPADMLDEGLGTTKEEERDQKLSALERQIAAAKRAKAALDARTDFLRYVKFTMPDLEEPDDVEKSMFKDAKHHRAICKVLEKVEKGEILRLIVTLPPRHGKSQLISRHFPSWYLAKNPNNNLIFATYNEPFSQDMGSDVRAIMTAPPFRQVFPHFKFRSGGLSREKLQSGFGGSIFFVGRGGSTTGRGADCLVEGTVVKTLAGDVPIEQLKVGTPSGIVLSYNHTTDSLEYKPVRAVVSRDSQEHLRITTAAGRVLEVTGNHRLFVNGEYRSASSVAPGDSFVQLLPARVHKAGLRGEEGDSSRPSGLLLHPRVQHGAPRVQELTPLQSLRQAYWARWHETRRHVLQGVQAEAGRQADYIPAKTDELPDVRQSLFGGLARSIIRQVGDVLLQTVRGDRAFATDVGRWQPQVEERSEPVTQAATLRQGIPGDEASHSGSGWARLRRLFGRVDPLGGPPHRRAANEQLGFQSGHALQQMPSVLARGEGFEAVGDVVAMVERVRAPARVYDIQVDDNANFFAEGVLVHNCLVIDDIMKDAEEASSPTVRQKTWEWFTQVAMTRLMTKFARVIIVMTRWHEDDLVGRLTDPTNPCYSEEEARKWKIINLPAIAEADDPLGRQPGEPLWPERFDLDFLEAARTLDPRGFSALYQQRPTPDDGDLFRAENIVLYERRDLPKDLRIYAASDHAIGEDKTRNDATVMVVGGVDSHGDLWILDVWWDKVGADKQVEAMLRLGKTHRPLMWYAEKGHITKAIGPFLRKRMIEERVFFAIQEVTPVANKVQRAQSILGRMANKRVRFPKFAPWIMKAREEMLKFPNARHDDFVDALAHLGMALDKMASPSAPRVVDDGPQYGTLGWLKADAAYREKRARLEAAVRGW